MEPLAIGAAVVVLTSVLSTIISALAIQAHWTDTQKRTVSGIVAIILATLAAVGTNQIDGLPPEWSVFVAKWVGLAGAVAFLAQGAYKQFKGILDALMQATSIQPADTATESEAADDNQDGSSEGTEGLPDPEPEEDSAA